MLMVKRVYLVVALLEYFEASVGVSVYPVLETRYLEWLLPKYRINDSSVTKIYNQSSLCRCRTMCRTLPRCDVASVTMTSTENVNCSLALDSNIIQFVPEESWITFFTRFGYEASKENMKVKEIGGDGSNNYYYSSDDPDYVYWIFKKSVRYAEALKGCAEFPNTHLAYFKNSKELDIGGHIIQHEQDSIPKDKLGRHYYHVDMFSDSFNKEILVKENQIRLKRSDFKDQFRVILNSNSTVYMQLSRKKDFFFLNDYLDERTFALCKSSLG